ncbi:MAG TPA: protein kinase [Terriglobales bacterium]|nr:protein kinase [Terriglobales bacterium]
MENQQISHYRVLRRIGGGGMGVVWAAQDLTLQRQVALKFLPADTENDPQALERLLREARAASALNHPNICTVYEVDEHQGRHFIAMELVEGMPLDQRINGRPLPLTLLLDLAEQIADALDAAHQKGVVHRDVKPANILVTAGNRVKVVDFGLAKLAEADRKKRVVTSAATADVSLAHLTSPGVALGTVAYMSPEQARGETLDARTDLFSFGAVLYEMATGALPFQGATSAVIFDAILNREPPPPSRLNSVTPPELERIIHKALEKDRELRYHGAAEMRTDLRRLKRDSESKRTAVVLGPPAAGTRGWKRVAGGLALVAVIAAAVLFVQSRAVPDPRVLRFNKVTETSGTKGCPFSAGNLIYFNQDDDGGGAAKLMQVATTGGDPLTIPVTLGSVGVVDISPTGSELAVFPQTGDDEVPLWILPVPSGSPRRAGGIVAHDATFSPDGSHVLYVTGLKLFTARTDGSDVREILTGSQYVDSPSWSIDGRIRYRQGVAGGRSASYWETDLNGAQPHELFGGATGLCCGTWTADGSYFLYGSRKPGQEGIWAVREKNGWFGGAANKPVLLSTGPLVYWCSVPSRAGKQIFVTAEQPQAELIRFDAASRRFAPLLGGIAAESARFSRDGQWVAYVAYPEGDLWRARADGTQRLRLTENMRTLLVDWAPDGRTISFVTRDPTISLQTISIDGGSPTSLPMGDAPTLAHAWSPDGNQIVLGEWVGTAAPVLRLLDLKTRVVTTVPGSEGLIYPIWSPDGRFIAAEAETGPRKGPWLYEVAARKWTRLPIDNFNYWAWSHDGKAIYFDTLGDRAAVMRLRNGAKQPEKVADLKGIRRAHGAFGSWFGLGPGDAPLLLRKTGSQQIYSVDWTAP